MQREITTKIEHANTKFWGILPIAPSKYYFINLKKNHVVLYDHKAPKNTWGAGVLKKV